MTSSVLGRQRDGANQVLAAKKESATPSPDDPRAEADGDTTACAKPEACAPADRRRRPPRAIGPRASAGCAPPDFKLGRIAGQDPLQVFRSVSLVLRTKCCASLAFRPGELTLLAPSGGPEARRSADQSLADLVVAIPSAPSFQRRVHMPSRTAVETSITRLGSQDRAGAHRPRATDAPKGAADRYSGYRGHRTCRETRHCGDRVDDPDRRRRRTLSRRHALTGEVSRHLLSPQ